MCKRMFLTDQGGKLLADGLIFCHIQRADVIRSQERCNRVMVSELHLDLEMKGRASALSKNERHQRLPFSWGMRVEETTAKEAKYFLLFLLCRCILARGTC